MDDADLILDTATQRVTVVDPTPTISCVWDEAVQQAVIAEAPGPTIASRAYAILHTAMFEAWAAYDPVASGPMAGEALQRPPEANTDANKAAAMSQAAYTVLTELFPNQRALFDGVMADLGSVPLEGTPTPGSPAGIGAMAGAMVMEARREDGANQANGYADTTGYTPVNRSPSEVIDITRWTPENVPLDPEDLDPEQSFLTPHWGEVDPFALPSGGALRPEAPEPFFLVDGAQLDLQSETITLPDGSVVPVSDALVGTVINPAFIDQAQRVVDAAANLTDEQKLIAEFWEDPGGTSFPPGTFMTFGQYVSARDDNTLDEDAVLFFALGNAMMDAGIATWEAKVFYDYARPVRAIRDLGELGLIGEPMVDPQTGEVIRDPDGEPAMFIPGRPDTDGNPTMIEATAFVPYQTPGSDPSPPFAEYTSGHSAFSAAGAAVLQAMTGSDAFGGSITFPVGSSRFEPGQTPAGEVTLSWDTFSAAADESGLSRIYGGIHFDDGNENGLALGAEVGGLAAEAADAFAAGARSGRRDGDDAMAGTAGSDLLVGAGGDDTMDGRSGADMIMGGEGADHLLAGAGADRMTGDAGDDTMNGGDGSDVAVGGDGADVIAGGTGADRVYGNGGGDRLFGNAGADLVSGGAGADLVSGGAGRDRVIGNAGADTLTGGAGTDALVGGGDADLFVFEAGAERDLLADFTVGEDRLAIDAALVGGAATGAAVWAAFGTALDGKLWLDFGADDLVAFGLDDADGFAASITIV